MQNQNYVTEAFAQHFVPPISETAFLESPGIMFVLDCAGCFCALNRAAERLFQCRAHELLQRPFTTVLDPFSYDKAQLMLAETLACGGVEHWELDHIQPNGSPVLVAYSTVVLFDTAGQQAGINVAGHLLTAQLNITAQLASTNQQLEGALLQLEKAHHDLKAMQLQLVQSEKMRALGQLVAGVAHEINNPAAFVANNIDYLAKLLPSIQALFAAYRPLRSVANAAQAAAIAAAEAAPQMQYLWQDLPDLISESQDGMQRIRNIVLSLRNFARLDEAAMKSAQINEGLLSTMQMIRPLCGNRITLIEQYAVLPSIECNPGQLNQVFLNLLMNAVQSIEDRGTIWVSSCWTAHQIEVIIRDTGNGMDQTTLVRLGEPFFTLKPVGTGTGLGLAICFRIIAEHHGSLRFISELGQGTIAKVILPSATEGQGATIQVKAEAR